MFSTPRRNLRVFDELYKPRTRSFSNKVSILDRLVGNVKKIQPKCFSKGWGDPILLQKILDLNERVKNGDKSYRRTLVNDNIDIHFSHRKDANNYTLIHGKFRSPAEEYLPEESKWSYFQMITPTKSNSSHPTPLCFHYSATGDDGYLYRRMKFGIPLIEKGIASIIIENPFYGLRKPKEQSSCSLSFVTDIMSIAVALVSESHSLTGYFSSKKNIFGKEFGPIIYTGMSMGGHMASIVGVESPEVVGIVPCLSPYSASTVFTKGVLSQWVDWKSLNSSLSFYLSSSDLLSKKSSEEYLYELLETVSDLRNFSVPKLPNAAIQVAAKYDAYVPGTGEILQKHWEGSKLYWVAQGHVGGFLMNSNLIVNAIVESCEAVKSHSSLSHP